MEIILSGIAVNVLTFLAGKLKISGTYVSIGLCLLLGSGYFFFQNFNPEALEKVIFYVSGMYAQSQVVYAIFKKSGLLEKLK